MNAPFKLARGLAAAPPPAGALVRFEAVSKIFPARGGSAPVAALDLVDLEVPAALVVGVIGRSGAGKSTLIRLANRLEKPSSGRVFFDGAEVSALSEFALRKARRSIGMVFQHFNLLSLRTVAGNVALPLELAGVEERVIRARVGELLELVGLPGKRDRYPAELSGGERQRVGIARALATRPKLLLSDEATSALDPETTRSILELLARINRELGLTILLITHEMSVIRAIAREVAVIEAGRIVEHGGLFEVFTRPRHAVTRSFLAEETGRVLPPSLQEKLLPRAVPDGQTILRVTFRGPFTSEPVIARLARDEEIEANIVAGTVDEIAGQPFGALVVGVPSGAEAEQALRFFAEYQLEAEVLGHVA